MAIDLEKEQLDKKVKIFHEVCLLYINKQFEESGSDFRFRVAEDFNVKPESIND